MALATADAICISSIYLTQTFILQISSEFGSGVLANFVPTVPLIGYAVGVAVIVFAPAAYNRLTIECESLMLSVALVFVGSAPNVFVLLLSNFFVGYLASVAQRLLAAGAGIVGPADAGRAIGHIIGAALSAVLCVRLLGQKLAICYGWRNVCFIAAAMGAISTVLLIVTRTPSCPSSFSASVQSSARTLWKSHRLLRLAGLQQAALFAAYNAGWITIIISVPFKEQPIVTVIGGFAGLVAALKAGALSDSRSNVAATAALAVFISTVVLLPIAYFDNQGSVHILLLVTGMALLDAGMQGGLVSNHARVQSLNADARTSLAGILTICSWLGAAIGIGAGYPLLRTFGWPATVAISAIAGCVGLLCSVLVAECGSTADTEGDRRASHGH